MTKRPYFNSGSLELEKLFEEHKCNREVLKQLEYELEHRTVKKAATLHEKVKKAIAELGKSGVTSRAPQKGPEQRLEIWKYTQQPVPVQGTLPLDRPTDPTPPRPVVNPTPPSDTTQAPIEKPRGTHSSPPPTRRIRKTGHYSDVPKKMVFPKGNDVKLRLKKDAPLVTRYKTALQALIDEMRRDKTGIKRVALRDGRRFDIGGQGYGYEFEYEGDDTSFFEGAAVTVTVPGAQSEGQVLSFGNHRIEISLQDDVGPYISSCILMIDNTAMLEALRKRLEAIESGSVPAFNSALAEAVIRNTGDERPSQPYVNIAADRNKELNPDQRGAIANILGNEVFYLWGPPGTGKTHTLAPLCKHLYDQQQRILICSNTNPAVDQVLLSLCKELTKHSAALVEGHIIRHGKIQKDSELDINWGGYIDINKITERKSSDLVSRRAQLERRLAAIEASIGPMQEIISEFNRLDVLVRDIAALESECSRDEQAFAASAAKILAATKKVEELDAERLRSVNSGSLMRLLYRSVESIEGDIRTERGRSANLAIERDAISLRLRNKRQRIASMVSEVDPTRKALIGIDRRSVEARLESAEGEKKPIRDELTDIMSKLADIEKAILLGARIVGATVTKIYLSPQLFESFDTVIIDEASMVILPALFNAAGLATKKVVISGDFRQLTPIVTTNQKEIYAEIGKDIFDTANLKSKLRVNGSAKRMAMLKDQYRMVPAICELISKPFYWGELKTAADRPVGEAPVPPIPFNDSLTIVDTASISPFVHRDPLGSRYNLMNALAIRNMCKHFAIRGVIPKHDSIGICTPYAAQTKILKSVIQGIADIECGTVHSYQGREKERMVLDIPDSLGEMGVGFFLHAGKEHDENDGAHLFNVAISRAREQLIVFANLSFLDKKLPEQAFLRDVLANMQTRGKVIDVREVLDLYPIIEDLRTYGHPLDLSAEAYSSGLFNQHDFEVVCGADMEQAKRGIAIFSGFVTPQRVRQYESLFRMKSAQGVAIRCVTRPPQKNGNIPPDQCTDALDGLEQMGCVVDTRGNIHEKVVIIDGKIVWFGSLNPLSHTSNTSEAMARHEGEKAAQQLATFMSLSARGGSDPSAGDVFCGENPRCPSCGSRTAHMIGQHGPYWLCEKGDWKKNVIQHKAAERLSGVVAEDAPQCECGMPMVIRSGPWGPFFGCSTFPKCSHMKPIKGRSPKPAKAPTRPSKPS